MPHPAHMFTEPQAQAFNREVTKQLDERRARAKARETQPQRPLNLLVFADADEARAARQVFDVQPDAEKILASVYEDQNEQFEIETQLLAILEHGIHKMSKQDRAEAKRKILGYEVKSGASLPGVLDTKVHVPGSLEKVREKLLDIERRLPRLQYEATVYANMKASLAPWPWSKINRLRNDELDQEQIMNGRSPHPRGGRSMAGYTIQP
jgi:hypothetical protein